MPVDASITTTALSLKWVWLLFNLAIVIISGFYFIFSLIVVRQVNLMTETVITELSPYLRFASVLHAGLSLGAILLFIGILLS